MTYVDCFMAAVPEANKAAYLAQAKMMAGLMKEYGALSVTAKRTKGSCFPG